MTREELQQMLDSFSESVKNISEADIDRALHCKSIAKDGGNTALKLGIGIHGLSDEERSKNGKIGGEISGNINKENGWASEVGTQWGRINMIEHMNKEVQCQHCGETTNLGNIVRYHKDGICKDREKFEQQIVNVYESGMSIGMLTKEFNLTEGAIYSILVNNNADIRPNQVLTEEDVWDILIELDNGVGRKDLEKLYGVSKGTIAHIAQGRSWPQVQEKYKQYKNKK